MLKDASADRFATVIGSGITIGHGAVIATRAVPLTGSVQLTVWRCGACFASSPHANVTWTSSPWVPLAKALLAGTISDGDDVRVEPDESTGRLRIELAPPQPAEENEPVEKTTELSSV